MADCVSYIVVVFLGDCRARIWCHIPADIKNLPSDDFPKPLYFEAECRGPMDNYGQQGTVIHRSLVTFIEFLFIFKLGFLAPSEVIHGTKLKDSKLKEDIFSPSYPLVFPRDNYFSMLPEIRLCQNKF